ncbi:transmembrane protein 271-like [Triplophysa dalaica]|uniref:transmembrane protein 271-like n=1 Tax=Triplophysa dalaica TaxID=1582913 RepID=UPI0024DF7080|nr:transmembrane protein 271-like [Triplophysa dalaica]
MKLSGKGLCTIVSSCVLFVCAVSAVVVGFRCVALGSRVRAHFHLSTVAGAFYSGILVALGQVLMGTALVFCQGKPKCGNFFLFGILVFLLGVLTAFSGAVVDGDTVSLVERKYAHYCEDTVDVDSACDRLKVYQRGLVASTVLNTLECLLGLMNLVIIKRYQAERVHRRRRMQRRSARTVVLNDERNFAVREFQPVSYINLGVFHALDETDGEVHSRGHPSIELPGYSPSNPELNHTYPFSFPLHELPPAYEDIFPGEESDT